LLTTEDAGGNNEVENVTCKDKKKIVEELNETFTSTMAYTVYIAFLQLFGR